MRIVVALGGNALLKRGELITSVNQRANVRVAAQALAPLALNHELIISHGNGPQVGLLALQATSVRGVEPYPLDVIGAQTEGMIGYMIEQELGNILPYSQPLASILTMVEVDPADPAFDNPTKPIGRVYKEAEARRLAEKRGWTIKPDGDGWRRVVPSPRPRRIFQLRPIRWLLDQGVIVICTGGGGIPTMYGEDGKLRGAEVVIDKDLASALLAKELSADLYIMATDVDAVYENWGTDQARPIHETNYARLKDSNYAEGSMGPKVIAACWFAESTGRTAAICELSAISEALDGKAGTVVSPCGEPTTEVFGIPTV